MNQPDTVITDEPNSPTKEELPANKPKRSTNPAIKCGIQIKVFC